MISSGAAAEAARFLTGAPARDFQTNYQTHDELWNSLSINLKQNFVITASCFVEYRGILPGQGYIVKDFIKIKNADGTAIRLIKLQNPWKKTENTAINGVTAEWSGKYSKNDNAWSGDLMEKAGYDSLTNE